MTDDGPQGDQPQSLLALRGVTKRFGPVQALDDVWLDINAGEVLALVGDNGAGKSTLVKVISGIYAADRAAVWFDGRPVSLGNPTAATRLGIATVYQDLALCDNLDVVENLFLGREERSPLGVVTRGLDETKMEQQAAELLQTLTVRLPSVRQEVGLLSGGQRQSVAIARAILFNAQILIMDEPTAALGPQETAQVAALIKKLKADGLGIFLISHDIHDVFDLADRVCVMKNGRVVGTVDKNKVTKDEVLAMIIMGKKPDEVSEKDLAELR